MLVKKQLAEIDESDLKTLVDNQVPEGKTIEYKSILPGNADGAKKKFLADVSSFANAAGGDLLFGIEEQAGIPKTLTGIQIKDVDAQKLRLEDMLRTGIDPRLPRVDIHPIALASKPSHYVLILRVQKSWFLLHRVIFNEHGHFYSRHSAGKYRLDVTELRTAFELLVTTAERIRESRAERLSRIGAGEETPVLLDEQIPKLILHIIPSSAFNPLVSVDMKVFNDNSQWDLMRPLVAFDGQPTTSLRFNLDGIARSAQWTRNAAAPVPIAAGYVQVFRNGIIEIVDVTILGVSGDKKQFLGEIFELRLLQAVEKHIELQQFLGIEPPVFIMVSLLGVRGYKINRGNSPSNCTEEIDRMNLIIPEVIIYTFDGGNDHITEVMRPVFDTTWNAANYPSSPN